MSFCFVSFRFKAKRNLQRYRDILFDILITSGGALALGMFFFFLHQTIVNRGEWA